MRTLSRSRTAGMIGVAVLAASLSGAVVPAQAGTAQGSQAAAASNAVLDWNGYAGEAAVAACIAPLDNPLHESRMYAMTHLAVHDALNAIDRRYQPYAYKRSAPAGASAQAAVAAAAHGVLVPVLRQLRSTPFAGCVDTAVATVEKRYAAELAKIPNGTSERRGVGVGRAAARAVLALRSKDGSDTLLIDTTYAEGTKPGQWRFTPDRPFAFAPGWGNVTPFVLRSAAQHGQGRPLPLTSARYAADVNEIKALGGDGVMTPTRRTPQQTQVALFWWESSPLMWNRITRTVARDRGLDMWRSARLFGLLDMALADGYVGSFATKYREPFWRPVTAIRQAHLDGNPATALDATWTPFQVTPPIPENDSAHAVEGGAAASVLRRFFGTDRVAFRMCSVTLPTGQACGQTGEVRRSFNSFSQAATENAVSRIYIGFHFRHAVVAGTRHGELIGTRAVAAFLRPVPAPPRTSRP